MWRLSYAQSVKSISLHFACIVIAIFCGVFVGASRLAVAEQGEIVAVVNVPKNLQQLANERAKSVSWLIAFKFKNGNYRMVGKEAMGANKVVVDFDALGSVIDVRTYLGFDFLPDAVRSAVKKEQPELKQATSIDAVQAVGTSNVDIDYYRIIGSTPTKKQLALNVTPDGKKVVDATLVDLPPVLKFQKVTSKDGGFQAEMPGVATERTSKVGEVERRVMEVVIADRLLFTIAYMDMPKSPRLLADPRGGMKAYRNGARSEQKIVEDKEIVLGKNKIPGFDYLVEAKSTNYVRERMFLDGVRLYQVYVVGSKDMVNSKDAEHFFNSFEILPK